MENFAFIIHPLNISDISRKYRLARYFPPRLVEKAAVHMPSKVVSHITGVRSPYNETQGWFVSCTVTSRLMLELPVDYVLGRIIEAGRVAEKAGARIVGLGAFTSVVGDAGITIANNLGIAVTTGNSYTVATALEGTKKAAMQMGHDLKHCHAAVVGATGSIGKVCARILAREVSQMTLVARDTAKLEDLAGVIFQETGVNVRTTSDIKQALSGADVVVAVTSAVDTIIGPEDLKPGAVVCDVSRPRNVSRLVAQKRDDVLVIEGGIVEVPGDVDFHFNFGFPPRTAYACMAETMILSLEKRYENFSLGRDLSLERVDEIARLGAKHGFKLAGFRSFERAVLPEEIDRVRKKAAALRTCVAG